MPQQPETSISIGDRVYDKYKQEKDGDEPSELVVVDIHTGTRADEFTVDGTDKTLDELVDEWPVNMPDSYNAAADSVVEVAFHESLDREFLGAWVEWDVGKVKSICERNGVVLYAYHCKRLTHDE